jgi:hypothetical protein
MAKKFNTLKQQYDDIGYWPTASTVLSAMTNFDRDTKTTTYKDFVTKTLNKAFALYKDYDQVSNIRCSISGRYSLCVGGFQRRCPLVGHSVVLRIPRIR